MKNADLKALRAYVQRNGLVGAASKFGVAEATIKRWLRVGVPERSKFAPIVSKTVRRSRAAVKAAKTRKDIQGFRPEDVKHPPAVQPDRLPRQSPWKTDEARSWRRRADDSGWRRVDRGSLSGWHRDFIVGQWWEDFDWSGQWLDAFMAAQRRFRASHVWGGVIFLVWEDKGSTYKGQLVQQGHFRGGTIKGHIEEVRSFEDVRAAWTNIFLENRQRRWDGSQLGSLAQTAETRIVFVVGAWFEMLKGKQRPISREDLTTPVFITDRPRPTRGTRRTRR